MKKPIFRFRSGRRSRAVDVLVEESPVEYRLDNVPVAVLMRTPGNDEELGLGFAITEGIVLGPNEVARIEKIEGPAEGDRYRIVLSEGVQVDPEQFRRNFFTSSSCGVCGKASIDAVRVAARTMADGPDVRAAVISAMPDLMADAQPLFADSGSIHAAAAFTPDGKLVTIFEDIGRHNALDKVIGHLARDRWPIRDTIVFVSGRISFEMVQKAAVAGIPLIAGVSGASDLAVALGKELNLTVIGFVRDNIFNVYCGVNRIV